MKTSTALLLLCTLTLSAQNQRFPAPSGGLSYDTGEQIVPTSATLVACTTSTPCSSGVAYMDAWSFYNPTGSSITVTISDVSTNCGGSACSRSFAIAAGQEMWMDRYGFRYVGGVKWSASATGLQGWIAWRQ